MSEEEKNSLLPFLTDFRSHVVDEFQLLYQEDRIWSDQKSGTSDEVNNHHPNYEIRWNALQPIRVSLKNFQHTIVSYTKNGNQISLSQATSEIKALYAMYFNQLNEYRGKEKKLYIINGGIVEQVFIEIEIYLAGLSSVEKLPLKVAYQTNDAQPILRGLSAFLKRRLGELSENQRNDLIRKVISDLSFDEELKDDKELLG